MSSSINSRSIRRRWELDETSIIFICRLLSMFFVKPNSAMVYAATVMLFIESRAFYLLSNLGMQMC